MYRMAIKLNKTPLLMCKNFGLLQLSKTWLRGMATDVSRDTSSRTISVTFDGQDQKHQYPFLWLRDNCQCSECYHPVSKQRLFLARNLDHNVQPQDVQIDTNNDIVIKWHDNHKSTFSQNWLKRRIFEEDNRRQFLSFYERKPKLWGSDLQNKIPRVHYEELITNDKALYEWIVTLEEIGLSLITDAPREVGPLRKIGELVAFLAKTNYGESFTVKSKEKPSSVAYSSSDLGLHTDLPFYHYTPGVQMLHCISQVPTTGGENQFSDGFYVAQQLKQNNPDLYDALKSIPVDFFDVGTDAYTFHKLAVVPVIQENREGEVIKITYNNQVRGHHTGLSIKEVELFYKALVEFEKLLNHEKCVVKYKLNNGDIACFHNYRVLHGRQGYKVTGEGERHLDGGYINWDELKSRRRVLQNQMST